VSAVSIARLIYDSAHTSRIRMTLAACVPDI
jgi:hypothetical protein